MGYDTWDSPRRMLMGGSRVVELGDKVRVFAVRRVYYDEDMTPIYSIPEPFEEQFKSLDALKSAHPENSPLWDSPILDNNKSLSVWKP